MNHNPSAGTSSKVTLAGLLITLGIVYGDVGTSPLYTVRAILNGASVINESFVLGAISCVFWTLTLQTTVKYIIITLRADNKGEGGILSLFALLKMRKSWVYLIAIIGGCALLADGIITPAITVTSAIEGLRLFNPDIPVVTVVLIILSVLFAIQQFGTNFLGKSFGPMMFFWFSMLGVLGISQIIYFPEVLKAINPYYAIKLLAEYPNGFVLLGAVFLCTTGAEALYSDLGHCGISNIRVSWIFVKSCLLLNYFGQGAWVITHANQITENVNPFYATMPQWFVMPGVFIATAAAIIASQALISGSYTIISEAISLNFFPKVRIQYPTTIKGQMYIPLINTVLYLGCCFVVLYFRESSGMEAAYGLSITIAMLMTSILLMFYLRSRVSPYLQALIGITFFTIELSFLAANMTKFSKGGWISVMIAGVFVLIMYIWHKGRRIKNSFITFVKIADYLPVIEAISKDQTIPKFATNLVYITHANYTTEIENKILYSILRKQPKRADVYWLLHVDIVDAPHTTEYEVHPLIPGTLIRIDLRLGFKVPTKVNLYFHKIIRDLMADQQVDMVSHYPSLNAYNVLSDFRYIVIDRVPNKDYDFENFQQFIMNMYFRIRKIGLSDVKNLGLDATNVRVESVPLLANSEIFERDAHADNTAPNTRKIKPNELKFIKVVK
ncbi:KUP/HAK/KT family potassium transporter [Parabacteroides sp. FAFU027]|uniref:KUP/HAK/KT family potassium transporter n=1 Tax=Parabacteroides sp. FAFU027 TaxID=2922715 RepID=UPI001FAF50D9|nr:KUP/HAK/KT family potassium transporter [Parabacteroides sp. FAFU027]